MNSLPTITILTLIFCIAMSTWVVVWILTHAARNTWTGILNCWDYRKEIPFFVWFYLPIAFVGNLWSAFLCFVNPRLEIEIIRQRKKP
jgi:hypothetical protein